MRIGGTIMILSMINLIYLIRGNIVSQDYLVGCLLGGVVIIILEMLFCEKHNALSTEEVK